jgi:hypothetical protein
MTLTAIKGLLVLDRFIEQNLFELFQTIIVQNRMVIFNGLHLTLCTVVGSLGLPLALSVFGLMRLPGGYIAMNVPFLRVFASRE